MARVSLIVLTLLTVMGCGPGGGAGELAGRERPLLVSAAVSLTAVLETLTAAYERDTGTRVELNLAASSALAAQIIAGAPVDLFISADGPQMDRVAAEGLIRAETRVDLLSNQLVVVMPVMPVMPVVPVVPVVPVAPVVLADVSANLTSPAALLEPRFGRIAIGDPDGVPVGVYARVYLESVGLWGSLRDRMVPVRSTRAALTTVETGAVDAGVVYRTDAVSSSRVRVVFEVPVSEGPAIAYPAALTTEATNLEAAEGLLAYLQGPDARAVFEAAGFLVPEA